MDLEKGTFISSVFGSPIEEYYLGKNTWSGIAADWKQRFEVGDAIIDPAGDWDPSSAETYIDSQIAIVTSDLASETLARQTGDSNLQTQISNLHAVSYDQQSLTDDQKAQALNNIEGKTYISGTFSGMGKVILKQNLVSDVNTLTQSMIQATNTIYVIRYDFDLGNQRITIPENCILEFDGGSLSNGELVGNETGIIWDNKSVIFKDKVYIIGTENVEGSERWGLWNVPFVSTRMFGNYIHEDTGKTLYWTVGTLNNSKFKSVVEIAEGDYYIDRDASDRRGFVTRGNTEYIFNGTLHLKTTSSEYYNLIFVHFDNVYIHGKGNLIGDIDTHTGSTGEWGHGICIEDASNIIIDGITISKCWGDGICVSTSGKNIQLRNCNISNCGRQGISITYAEDYIIEGCTISTINRTTPRYAIDVEPGSDGIEHCKNGIIRNNVLNNRRCILLTKGNSPLTDAVDNVLVENNALNGIYSDDTSKTPYPYSLFVAEAKNVVVNNNKITGDFVIVGSVENGIGTIVSGNRIKAQQQYLLGDNIIFENNICAEGAIEAYGAYEYTNGSNVDVIIPKRCSKVIIRNNTLNNVYFYFYVDLTNDINSLIENNIIIINRTGQTLNYLTLNGTIKGNIIKTNGYERIFQIEGGEILMINNIMSGLVSPKWAVRINANVTGKLISINNTFPLDASVSIHPTNPNFELIEGNIANQSRGTVRPTVVTPGYQFYDITLGKPIWYNGNANTGWIDAVGNEV